MQTARDKHVFKVRVLINKNSAWTAKTFFYSREVFALRWVERAENNPNLHVDFYGTYSLEENSG